MNTVYKRRNFSYYILIFIMLIVVVITLYPFLNVLARSFNEPDDTVRGGITLYPRKPTTENYVNLFSSGSNLSVAFRNSVFRTILGGLVTTLRFIGIII
jgi:putative aldouronate transport system permease protein